MSDNQYYIYKKEVDWSLLHQGFSIPLNTQVVFQKNINHFIKRGESKDVFLMLEGKSYQVKLVNQLFDEERYPNHKDILQIRYNPQSEIAIELRRIFLDSYTFLKQQRAGIPVGRKAYIDMPEASKEHLAVYTTLYEDTYLIESITARDIQIVKETLIQESEQEYETLQNYDIIDPKATILAVQQLTKVRKLNKAIGENLKLLYDYKCQICGEDFGKNYNAHIVESHHIDPFVTSFNNNASNQIIICPNHHRVIHKAIPVWNRRNLTFTYMNGAEEKIAINRHL